MSRLTHATYCQRRQRLRHIWDEQNELYGRLSSGDQQALHIFFVPTIEAPDAELRQYRKDVTAIDSSLPQRAGRAYGRIERGERVPRLRLPIGKGERYAYVEMTRRPVPDFHLLSKAVMSIVLRELGIESPYRLE